jgi:2-haloacid dehalogenase
MPRAFAFDAYGTLFDIGAAVARHRDRIGAAADPLVALWRQKQLEYTWVRSLAGRYRDFWSLTAEALDYAMARYGLADAALRADLLDAYWTLDAYPDAAPALAALRGKGVRLALFTNGGPDMARAAMKASGLDALIDDLVSVDAVGIYKTSPLAYALLRDRLSLDASEIALVSSNRWDIAGGSAFGLEAIYLDRLGMPEEYADLAPSRRIASLIDLIA